MTRYYYDLNNRKIREVRPSVAGSTAAQRVTDYFYDSADHLVREVTHSFAGGADRTLIYEYDSLDRLVRKVIQKDGTSTVVEDESLFTYENQLDATLLKTAVNGVASLSFSNEAAPPFASGGFSVAASQSGNPLGLIEGAFGITRDVTGEIASVSKNGTALFTKSYDPAGRLTNVAAGSFSTAIGYDGFGNRSSIQHSTGESGTFQRDLLERLTSVQWTGPTPISETLTYDIAGNVQTLGRENGTHTLAHDAVDQIISSATTGSANYNRNWSYDALGGRLGDSQNGSGSFINNFLIANAQSSFLADPDGFGEVIRETSGSAVKNFFFRVDDRLSGYTDSANQVAYYYDPLGRRIAKVFNGVAGNFSQSFVHLGMEDRILMAKAGDGTVTSFLEGQRMDEHLGEIRNGVFKGYITDHLESVLNGEAAGTGHSFGLFGEPLASVSLTVTSNPVMYGYTGREFEPESKFSYHRARTYNPSIGRWLSQDPSGTDSGLNFYSYTENSPVRFLDPMGLAKCTYSISGQKLVCTSNSGGQSYTIAGAQTIFSGNGRGANDPDQQYIPNTGPIPTGEYRMVRDKSSDSKWTLAPTFFTRVRNLQRTMNRTKHSGYQLHIGGFSEGCITVSKKDNAAKIIYTDLDSLLQEEEGTNILDVER